MGSSFSKIKRSTDHIPSHLLNPFNPEKFALIEKFDQQDSTIDWVDEFFRYHVVSQCPQSKARDAMKRNSNSQETTKRNCGIDSLPPEIVKHIFGFLDWQGLYNAIRVCWYWNSLGDLRNRWRKLDLGKYSEYHQSLCVYSILQKNRNVKHIMVISAPAKFFENLAQICPKVTTIEFDTRNQRENFKYQYSTRSIVPMDIRLFSETNLNFLSKFKNLTTINVAGLLNLPRDWFVTLFDICPKITQIRMDSMIIDTLRYINSRYLRRYTVKELVIEIFDTDLDFLRTYKIPTLLTSLINLKLIVNYSSFKQIPEQNSTWDFPPAPPGSKPSVLARETHIVASSRFENHNHFRHMNFKSLLPSLDGAGVRVLTLENFLYTKDLPKVLHCAFVDLETLRLISMENLSNRALARFINVICSLKRIELVRCSNISRTLVRNVSDPFWIALRKKEPHREVHKILRNMP